MAVYTKRCEIQSKNEDEKSRWEAIFVVIWLVKEYGPRNGIETPSSRFRGSFWARPMTNCMYAALVVVLWETRTDDQKERTRKSKKNENCHYFTIFFKRVKNSVRRSVCRTSNQSLSCCIRESNVLLCSLHHQEDLTCSRQRICVAVAFGEEARSRSTMAITL